MSVKNDLSRSVSAQAPSMGAPPTNAAKAKTPAPTKASEADSFSRDSSGHGGFDVDAPQALSEPEAKRVLAALAEDISRIPDDIQFATTECVHAAKQAAWLVASRPQMKAAVWEQAMRLDAQVAKVADWPGLGASILTESRQTALSQYARLLTALKPESAAAAQVHSARVAAFQNALPQARQDDAFRLEVLARATATLGTHFAALDDGTERSKLAAIIAGEQSRLISAGASPPLIAVLEEVRKAADNGDVTAAQHACNVIFASQPFALSDAETHALHALLAATIDALAAKGPDFSDVYHRMASDVSAHYNAGLAQLDALSGTPLHDFETAHGPVAKQRARLAAVIHDLAQPFTSRDQLFHLLAAYPDLAPQTFAALGFTHLTSFPVGEADTQGWSHVEASLHVAATHFERSEKYAHYAISAAIVVGVAGVIVFSGGLAGPLTGGLLLAGASAGASAGVFVADATNFTQAAFHLRDTRDAASVHVASSARVAQADNARTAAFVDVSVDVVLAAFNAATLVGRAGKMVALPVARGAGAMIAKHAKLPLVMGLVGAGREGLAAAFDHDQPHDVALVVSGAWHGFVHGVETGVVTEALRVVGTKAVLRFGGKATLVTQTGTATPEIKPVEVSPADLETGEIQIDGRPLQVDKVVNVALEAPPKGFDAMSAEKAAAGAKGVQIQVVAAQPRLPPPTKGGLRLRKTQ